LFGMGTYRERMKEDLITEKEQTGANSELSDTRAYRKMGLGLP